MPGNENSIASPLEIRFKRHSGFVLFLINVNFILKKFWIYEVARSGLWRSQIITDILGWPERYLGENLMDENA